MQRRVLKSNYTILDEIGRGGFGTVFLASDRHDKLWAIKALSLDVTNLDEAQKVRDLFDREQKMLSWLSHPSIVRRREVFAEDSRVYLVMEYIDGEDLHRIMARLKRGLSPALVVSVAEQVCEILAYLHGQKPHPIVFRDLKPSNLMLNREGQIKLVDFGIARLARFAHEGEEIEPPVSGSDQGHLFVGRTVALPGGQTFRNQTTEVLETSDQAIFSRLLGRGENIQDTTCMGTPGYAAPEQYAGSGLRTDPRADIYALGAIMFNLLTKEEPAHLTIPLPVTGFVDKMLEGLMVRATAVDRERRFPSARAMATALAIYRKTLGDDKTAEQLRSILSKPRRQAPASPSGNKSSSVSPRPNKGERRYTKPLLAVLGAVGVACSFMGKTSHSQSPDLPSADDTYCCIRYHAYSMLVTGRGTIDFHGPSGNLQSVVSQGVAKEIIDSSGPASEQSSPQYYSLQSKEWDKNMVVVYRQGVKVIVWKPDVQRVTQLLNNWRRVAEEAGWEENSYVREMFRVIPHNRPL